MKVFYNSSYIGQYPVGTCVHFPVGVCAIIVAENAKTASYILNQRLIEVGLQGDSKAEDMVEVVQTFAHIVVPNGNVSEKSAGNPE